MTTPTGRVIVNQTITADGYAAGVNQTEQRPFGEDGGDGWGDRLHAWMFDRAEENQAEIEQMAGARVHIMGRNMFGPVRAGWDRDWNGWWGDDPPFHGPVFVLTHHARDPQPMEGDHLPLRHRRHRSGTRTSPRSGWRRRHLDPGWCRHHQSVPGGGFVDELRLQIFPFTIGAGAWLFDGVPPLGLEQLKSRASGAITHLTYRVAAGTG